MTAELPTVIEMANDIKLIKIPKGNGIIGVKGFFEPARNKPIIQVSINHDVYLSKTCITSRQWKSMGIADPSRFHDLDSPVESVSRRKALNFISMLNNQFPNIDGMEGKFRLPTEVEWEYSARAGDKSKRPGPDYHFGGMGKRGSGPIQGSLEESFISKGGRPNLVGEDSVNAWGFRGMIGGVAEHCVDPYVESNAKAPRDGSPRLGKGVIMEGDEMFSQRGGSFDINPKDLTYYWKAGVSMDDADARDGLRIAWVPK
jgi:formylglycine-generating enzyme required for sulfatase activity